MKKWIRSLKVSIKILIKRFLRHPIVVHFIAASDRFSSRLGSQFANAIAYFSILAMVPVVMFAFSTAGWVLTVLRPELWAKTEILIESMLKSNEVSRSISHTLLGLLQSWRGVQLVALIIALYTGSSWIGNLRSAIRSQWHDDWPHIQNRPNFILELLINMVLFLAMLLLIALGVVFTFMSTTLNDQVLQWLSIDNMFWSRALFSALGLLSTLIVSWGLVLFLFLTLTGAPVDKKPLFTGTFMAALAITMLQSLAGIVIGMFKANRAVQLFGPIIVLMLFFNLLATILMFTAAWIGSARNLKASTAAETIIENEKTIELDNSIASQTSISDFTVEDIAKKTSKISMFVGFGLGLSTGTGLGILVATVLRKLKIKK